MNEYSNEKNAKRKMNEEEPIEKELAQTEIVEKVNAKRGINNVLVLHLL